MNQLLSQIEVYYSLDLDTHNEVTRKRCSADE